MAVKTDGKMRNPEFVQAGDNPEAWQQFTFTIGGMMGAQLGGGRNGKLPVGNYEFEILPETKIVKKSGDKTGHNLELVTKIAGPSKYAGTPIRKWIPLPVGADSSAQAGEDTIRRLILSMASARGTMDKVTKQESVPFQVPQTFGKKFYAQLRDGENGPNGDFSDTSEIGYFLSKDDYDANPGPADKSAEAPASTAQTTAPELNGTQPPKPAAKAATAAAAAQANW